MFGPDTRVCLSNRADLSSPLLQGQLLILPYPLSYKQPVTKSECPQWCPEQPEWLVKRCWFSTGFSRYDGWQCRVCVRMFSPLAMYYKSESAQLQGTQSKYKVMILSSKGEEGKEEERSGSHSFWGLPFLLSHSCLKKQGVKAVFYIQGQRAPSLETPVMQRKPKLFNWQVTVVFHFKIITKNLNALSEAFIKEAVCFQLWKLDAHWSCFPYQPVQTDVFLSLLKRPNYAIGSHLVLFSLVFCHITIRSRKN